MKIEVTVESRNVLDKENLEVAWTAHLVMKKVTVKVVMLLMVRQIRKLELLSLKVLNVCLH